NCAKSGKRPSRALRRACPELVEVRESQMAAPVGVSRRPIRSFARTDPPYPQVHAISTPHPRLPASFAPFQRFSFALCLFYHFSASVTNSIHPSYLPPTNYSFKMIFRVFRDFHSVPVKPQLCSSWSILYIQSQKPLL